MAEALLQNLINEEVRVAKTELENLPMSSDLSSMILLTKKNVNDIAGINKRMNSGVGSGSILYDNMSSCPMTPCATEISFLYNFKRNVMSEQTIKNGFGMKAGEDIKYDSPTGATFGYSQTADFGRGFGWNLDDEKLNNLLSKGLNGAKFEYIKKSINDWKNNIAQNFGWQTLFGRGIINPVKTDLTMYNSAITATYGLPQYNEMNGLFTYLFDNTHSLYGISQTVAPKWRVNYVTFTGSGLNNWYTDGQVDSFSDLVEKTSVTKVPGEPVILNILHRIMMATDPNNSQKNRVICVSPNMHYVISSALRAINYTAGNMTNEALQKMITYNNGGELTSVLEYNGWPIKAMLDGYDTDGAALTSTGINAKDFVSHWWPDDYIAILNLDDFDFYYDESVPFAFAEGITIPGKWFSNLATFSGSGQIICKNRSRQTVIKFPSNLAI